MKRGERGEVERRVEGLCPLPKPNYLIQIYTHPTSLLLNTQLALGGDRRYSTSSWVVYRLSQKLRGIRGKWATVPGAFKKFTGTDAPTPTPTRTHALTT